MTVDSGERDERFLAPLLTRGRDWQAPVGLAIHGEELEDKGSGALDGKSIFRDLAHRVDAPQWMRVRDGQMLLPSVVDDHLHYIEWASDGYPIRLRLRSYQQASADVILDPRFGYGKPVFERTKVRAKDVMRQFLAGERPEDIAEDYGLTEDEVLAAIRVLSRRDAA